MLKFDAKDVVATVGYYDTLYVPRRSYLIEYHEYKSFQVKNYKFFGI